MAIDIDKLEALYTQATPGEWVVDDLGDKFFDETNHKWGIGSKSCTTHRVAKIEGLGDKPRATADFIAASHNELPAILAELRLLRELERRAILANDDELPAGPTCRMLREAIEWLDEQRKVK